MKILQLVTKRQYRGAEVFAANLSSELIKFGHEVLLVGLYKNEHNILVVPHAQNLDLVSKKNGSFSPAVVKKLTELIRTTKPDVIQCNGSDTLKYMVAASFFLPKIPILYRNISIISEWMYGYPKKILYNQVFQRISHVSSVGNEAIEDFISTFHFPREKTSVIRRGIPIKKIDPVSARKKLVSKLGLAKEDRIVIHIGNFCSEKNHAFLIDIFSKLRISHPHLKLVCVGDGVLFPAIKKEIEQKQLEDTVFLLGFRKNIPRLLAASDCCVLSSKVEGVPGVILEAAVQSKPSVATNVGGVKEVLIDGETGFYINNFDQNDFTEKIVKLTTDEDLRIKMGQKAFALVYEEFNPSKNAKKFESLYSKLAGEQLLTH